MVERVKPDEAADLQATIDELAAHSAELAALLHETVTAFAALATGRRAPADDEGEVPAVDPAPLAADVLEIATLQAQAAGVPVDEYLREAVLAYAARADPDGGDGAGRSRQALAAARRLRAESEALKAENAQATAHSQEVSRRVQVSRRARVDDDGKPAGSSS
jgi:hypothetical protein